MSKNLERLTESRIILNDKTVFYGLSKAPGKTCGELCEKQESCDWCPVQEALHKLAAYENSGLTPEEVVGLMKNTKGKVQ